MLILVAESSCSTVNKNEHKPLIPENLISVKLDNIFTGVASDQTKADIQYLLYGLKNAYVGRVVFNEDQWQIFLKKIELLSLLKFDNINSFCEAIDTVLDSLPDNHLKTNSCGIRKKPTLRIGKNVAGTQVWKISTIPKNVGLIGISTFPSKNNKLWNGFAESFKKIEKTKALIIDLRGNGGGDDSMGRRLAKFLLGQECPPMVFKKITSQTPETFALYLNEVLSEIDYLKKNKKDVPAYLTDEQTQWEEKFVNSKKGQYPPIETKSFSRKAVDKKMIHYNKPLYVLADQGCGSSCESTIDALRSHPRFILVGKNTKGQHAFGNVLPITLPNSKIEILLASHHLKFIDKANIEKTGFHPSIIVRDDEDALSHVLEIIR